MKNNLFFIYVSQSVLIGTEKSSVSVPLVYLASFDLILCSPFILPSSILISNKKCLRFLTLSQINSHSIIIYCLIKRISLYLADPGLRLCKITLYLNLIQSSSEDGVDWKIESKMWDTSYGSKNLKNLSVINARSFFQRIRYSP